MPVPRQYSPSVQAYYYLQYSASTDIWYRHSNILSTAPIPTNNSQPSDISDEYQYPAVFHSVLCQYNASTDIRPAVLARYQASCKFPPGCLPRLHFDEAKTYNFKKCSNFLLNINISLKLF